MGWGGMGILCSGIIKCGNCLRFGVRQRDEMGTLCSGIPAFGNYLSALKWEGGMGWEYCAQEFQNVGMSTALGWEAGMGILCSEKCSAFPFSFPKSPLRCCTRKILFLALKFWKILTLAAKMDLRRISWSSCGIAESEWCPKAREKWEHPGSPAVKTPAPPTCTCSTFPFPFLGFSPKSHGDPSLWICIFTTY